ncbi:MAG: hypothetical protein ACR2IT_09480 [Pirellulales bacterium]
MAAKKYAPLKDFVATQSGARLAPHSGVRDRLVEIAVEEYPLDAPNDRALDVLKARMRIRIKQEYGSVVAMILISILANLVARAIWEWIKKRRSHRELVSCWQEQARAKEG